MEVRCFTGGNFAQNGYIASCEATGRCVIVDPGAEAHDMVAAGEAGAGELTAILLTVATLSCAGVITGLIAHHILKC